MDKEQLLKSVKGLDVKGKDTIALYNEISIAVMEAARGDISKPALRNAYYLSMEFLIGRSFYNNFLTLGILDDVKGILEQKGVDISVFEEIEDAALGNGGLGRLAACFLDSAAGLGLPLYGYGIRYKYGLFKQAIENGFQVELPDDWQKFGDPWSVRRENEKRIIKFADMEVTAVPYDMPVFGKRTNVLRLFQAEGSVKAQKISEYLYPADDTEEGKILRIRQEYFLSAAAIGDIVREYEKRHGRDFRYFTEENSIQLNDTHPVFAIPELIRVLREKGVAYRSALKISKRVFNYTNHTILSEALECWDVRLIQKVLPEIYEILLSLNRSAQYRHKKEGYTSQEAEKAALLLRSRHAFSMANTAVFIANKINGVAEIHSEIIKRDLFSAEYNHHPGKFENVTNGVAQRRWLELANRELSELFDKQIGRNWRGCFDELKHLNTYTTDKQFLLEFIQTKREKKEQLFKYIEKTENVKIVGDRVLYAQVKRLHEYKRQLMTAFALLRLYYDLKEKKVQDFVPSVFLFGAKCAPSYFRAKGIIKYINEIIEKINADPETNDRLMGVFVTEYNVSYAEKIVAAADVSLQVSTAGFEASGTGNMKFMMNGAVTLGTMDGANIEIIGKAGEENNYIFGASVDEINKLRETDYEPKIYLEKHPEWKRIVETLVDSTFSDDNKGYFKELYESLTIGANWHKPDHYFIFRDIEEYYQRIVQVNKDYKNRIDFAEKQLKNAANSYYFSSDRSIAEYAKRIWKL